MAVFDYERAITPNTAMLLKVHRSNFSMTGFVHEVEVRDLVGLGAARGIPVMYDLGSGALVDVHTRGLPAEPTVQGAVAAGCALVTFSGDKLLGGPQAGIIVGRAEAVDRCRRHPLARAVRVDRPDPAAPGPPPPPHPPPPDDLAAAVDAFRCPPRPTPPPSLRLTPPTHPRRPLLSSSVRPGTSITGRAPPCRRSPASLPIARRTRSGG